MKRSMHGVRLHGKHERSVLVAPGKAECFSSSAKHNTQQYTIPHTTQHNTVQHNTTKKPHLKQHNKKTTLKTTQQDKTQKRQHNTY